MISSSVALKKNLKKLDYNTDNETINIIMA